MAVPLFQSAELKHYSGNGYNGQYVVITWSQNITAGSISTYPVLKISGTNQRNITTIANPDQIVTLLNQSVYKLPLTGDYLVFWSDYINLDVPANLVKNGTDQNTATTGNQITNLSTVADSKTWQGTFRQKVMFDKRKLPLQ